MFICFIRNNDATRNNGISYNIKWYKNCPESSDGEKYVSLRIKNMKNMFPWE